MAATTTVIVADDHPLVRGALKAALTQTLTDVAILEAGTLMEALKLLRSTPDTDLVLLDLHMPGMNGFGGLFALKSEHPATPVAVISATEDPAIMRRSVDYGAQGFVPKSAALTTIGDAIRTVLAGDVWLPEQAENAPGLDEEEAELAAKIAQLTPQQMRVLSMLQEGKLNKQIAYELDVTEATIKAHVSAILRKLNVYSRTQAVIMANRLAVDDSPAEALMAQAAQ